MTNHSNIVFLGNQAFVDRDLSPRDNANNLAVFSGANRCLYVPLSDQHLGKVVRSVFKILIGNYEYKIIWHDSVLIAVMRKEYGFDTEINVWPAI